MNYKYILFYKPFNVICQFSPEGDKVTLKEFIDIPDIYSVGRLDYDSEGLLILTNDNKLKHLLTDPKFESEKTYYVQVENIPSEEDLDKIRKGIKMKDYIAKPCKVKRIDDPNLEPRNPPIRVRQSIPDCWIQIKISEGKNRQIRKMTAAIGFPTLRLVRTKIKNIGIGDLKAGEYRELTLIEVNSLFKGGNNR